jgi:adenylate kinase family enzyme
MQRVLIIGSPGSGKSTFARRLGALTGLPVVHIDQLFWDPGWVQVPSRLYLARLRDALSEDRWIMDGNYTSSLDLRLPRADRIILLDRSRLSCVRRIGQRIASSHGQVRADMAAGCPERIDWAFLKYVWNYPNKDRQETLAAIGRHGAWDRATTLKSDAESAAFLNSVRLAPDKLNAG